MVLKLSSKVCNETPVLYRNVDHKTCPICREKLETTDDTWVLEELPDQQQVDQEIQKSLFNLI